MANLELLRVEQPAHWSAFHRIRREVLFEARGRIGVYVSDHPDDLDPNNHPLLLLEQGRPRATTRVDLLGEHRAGIRLVAVEQENQRRGLGRSLMMLTEQYAMERGVLVLELNSAPDAVMFYQRLGWTLIDPARENPLLERKLG